LLVVLDFLQSVFSGLQAELPLLIASSFDC
jgi:hypothetical protein